MTLTRLGEICTWAFIVASGILCAFLLTHMFVVLEDEYKTQQACEQIGGVHLGGYCVDNSVLLEVRDGS